MTAPREDQYRRHRHISAGALSALFCLGGARGPLSTRIVVQVDRRGGRAKAEIPCTGLPPAASSAEAAAAPEAQGEQEVEVAVEASRMFFVLNKDPIRASPHRAKMPIRRLQPTLDSNQKTISNLRGIPTLHSTEMPTRSIGPSLRNPARNRGPLGSAWLAGKRHLKTGPTQGWRPCRRRGVVVVVDGGAGQLAERRRAAAEREALDQEPASMLAGLPNDPSSCLAESVSM